MKKIRYIALFALLLPTIMQAQTKKEPIQKPSLVVFVTGMGNDPVSNYFTNLISNNLARTYTIVPRTRALKRKLQELKEYEDAGHTDDRQLIEWGHQNNVSVLCLVTAAHVGEYMFSAQLTDVKSNTLIGNAEYEIPSLSSEDLKKAASALAAQMQRKKNN